MNARLNSIMSRSDNNNKKKIVGEITAIKKSLIRQKCSDREIIKFKRECESYVQLCAKICTALARLVGKRRKLRTHAND